MKNKRAIYFNQTFNQSNPPSYAVCLTYDDVNGLQIVDDKKTISISTTTDVAQNQKIKELTERIITLEQESTSFDKDELLSNKYQLNDYTAFEVFAHDYDIPVGECKELGGYVTNAIPACMNEHFVIRTVYPKKDMDVVVDWGDGESTKLSEMDDSLITDYRYHMIHTYKQTGKYIIKIYGKTYYNVCGRGIKSTDPAYIQYKNTHDSLMCRVFDFDLPVASHIYSYVSMCMSSQRLLNVYVFGSNFKFNAYHIDSLFSGCSNLLTAIGFQAQCNNHKQASGVFGSCKALKQTDFVINSTPYAGIYTMFSNCINLEADISTLFPKTFIPPKEGCNMGFAFQNCKKLYGTVPADKLWNNKDVKWTATSKCFYGCSKEIKAQVPVSWGGTASDDIIEKSLEEKYNELLEKINYIEENLKQTNN